MTVSTNGKRQFKIRKFGKRKNKFYVAKKEGRLWKKISPIIPTRNKAIRYLMTTVSKERYKHTY